jgi:hypothetical protein
MTVSINGSSSVTINSGAVLGITSSTAQASTSGTSIDFTSIPSWVKRITLMFSGVSTSGTSNPWLIQLGDSGGIETTGYTGASVATGVSSAATYNYTTGIALQVDNSAAVILSGSMTISLLNSATNTWTASGIFGQSDRAYSVYAAYSKSLSATLDRVRVTTTNGTDTFDAGSINILYE